MTITLADIEASEKICDEAIPPPWKLRDVTHGLDIVISPTQLRVEMMSNGDRAIEDAGFVTHARTQLPAMNALVRKLANAIGYWITCEQTHDFGCYCGMDEARRLVERMEGAQP